MARLFWLLQTEGVQQYFGPRVGDDLAVLAKFSDAMSGAHTEEVRDKDYLILPTLVWRAQGGAALFEFCRRGWQHLAQCHGNLSDSQIKSYHIRMNLDRNLKGLTHLRR